MSRSSLPIFTIVANPSTKLFFHLWFSQKTILAHYLFTWDYFHIHNTTSVLVIHKNVINHSFSFTWCKFYKLTYWKQVFSKRSPLPTAQPNNLIIPSFIYPIPTPFPPCPPPSQEPIPNHPYHYQQGHESHYLPTPSHLSQPCSLVHKTPPFHLLIYQLVGNSKIYLPNYIPNNNIDIHLSVIKPIAPTTFPINQLTSITPTSFSALQPPFQKIYKTISNHLSPLSYTPHFLQTANINTSFQNLRYFTSLSQHRSHIPCWKPDSKLYVRFSHHSTTSALNFSSGVQCFLSNIGRHW